MIVHAHCTLVIMVGTAAGTAAAGTGGGAAAGGTGAVGDEGQWR